MQPIPLNTMVFIVRDESTPSNLSPVPPLPFNPSRQILATEANPTLPLPRRNRGNYANSLGSQLTDSLRVLDLEPGVTRRAVNIRYRFLACRLHPNKHDPEVTGMTSEEAVELFKRVNNAQQIIRESMWTFH